MTFGLLQEIFRQNGISDSVRFMSNSGWECSATDMDGIYYHPYENLVVFTQGFSDDEYRNPPWMCLFKCAVLGAGSNPLD